MPRVVSFIVLVAIALLVGAVFFKVMASFLVPMFLACVLVVIFQPVYERLLSKFPGHPRLAALATTLFIMLVVLLPLVGLGWKAYEECRDVYRALEAGEGERVANELLTRVASLYSYVSGEDVDSKELKERIARLKERIDTAALVKNGTNLVGAAVLFGVRTALGILIGLAIMVISLYYFLADGPGMIRTLMRLSPLEAKYERELLERFSQVSRSVVVATLLSAVVQGVVAGIGYYIALPSNAPIFLLIALTMVTAIVPFVGAAGVWVPTCIGVYLYGDWPAAVGLALFCGIIVSTLDNVIKPLVLHGQSNLHPLLALLSILGGVQVLGPVGILVGPMLVSFLQALLNMLQRELARFNGTGAVADLVAAGPSGAVAPPVSAIVPSQTEKSAKPKEPKKGK